MPSIIETNPEILNGKPVFKGTRIPVDLVYELIGLGYSIEYILEEYPTLSREQIIGALKIGKGALISLQGEIIDELILEGK
ncbi:MAG: DUF433 domain-containing protein [Candidatus Hermodarchaeota archaeon]